MTSDPRADVAGFNRMLVGGGTDVLGLITQIGGVWKRLCILHLRVYCRWTNEMIGKAFGHPRGHISRIVASTKEELRTHFRLERSQKERPKPRDPDTNPDRPRESKTGEHPRYGSSSSFAGPVRGVTDWR